LSTYRTRDPKLKPYQDLVTLLAKQFRQLIYIHTLRSQNILADALASLASSLSFPLSRSAETITVQRLEAPSTQDPWFVNLRSSLVLKAERKEAKELLLVELGEMMLEERPWYHEIEQYCRDGTFPEEAEVEDRRAIRRAALKYTLIGEVLYRRALNKMLLRCVTDEEAWKIALLVQLELLDERRLAAADHVLAYQNRLSRSFQKKVIEHKFQEGDMVLKRIFIKPGGPRYKLSANWEGPYVIKEVYPRNAYRLVNVEGEELSHPWNGLYLKRFYP
ncbi:hypothetical protein Taro_032652, partial [Colocasia esculenta]|nr:hypothetical protein [Colocasia esculenta]